MAVTFTRTDLEFLLTQIIAAENNTPPLNPSLSFGLREVAGTNNNAVAGQGNFGAADQPFATITQQYFLTVNVDGTPFDPNPGVAGDTMSYSSTTPGAMMGVNVVDGAPRTISNLIADTSTSNPAALQAAQQFGAQLGDGYAHFVTNPTGITMPGADGVFGTADDILPADQQNLFIGNITPDAGLSAPFNSWMTYFGQFFDHGLDLITKGNAGTVFIPLAADDPLVAGADGQFGTADDLPASLRFMALTRATNKTVSAGADGLVGTADDIHQNINTTTPFVDQNQTYSSHPSHQVFLREYITGADGKLHATGRLLTHAAGKDGIAGNADDNSGMATWADVKANALKLGIVLTDLNVGNVPVLLTDAYGNFVRSSFGGAIVVTSGGQVHMDPANPAALPATTLFTDHAFINDMAHTASPWSSSGMLLAADTDTVAGGPVAAGQYDNELLDAHYVAGDGRANENIALTAVHEIFHDEHNRLVNQIKDMVRAELANGDTGFASQWVVAGADLSNGIQDNEWNGERIFQAAKFGTETQYQHLVFEEFARKIAPTIPLFGNVNINLDPAITSEFANAVYRFGHSMLDENVALFELNTDGTMKIGADGKPVMTSLGLIEAFTNPLAFANLGASGTAQIVQGNTHQIGSEIDEFVTGALRNNLLGLPLDLAALNIARGRDTGVAPLNLVRAQIYDAVADQTLKPYANWAEFGQFLKHPASLINFVAAYGLHSSVASATTLADKRAAAVTLVTLGLDAANASTADATARDAYDFMHSQGAWANNTRNAGADGKLNTADDTWAGGTNASKALLNISPGADGIMGTADDVSRAAMWATGSVTGVDNIDLWIGGLAEKQTLFGGLLGTTFNFIFETQLTKLQDADRLYYLPRIEGMDFGFQIENNSFAAMIIANTGAKHIPASIFLTPEYTVEAGDYFLRNPDGTFQLDAAGHRIATDSATWLRNPVTGALLVEVKPDGTVHFIGDDNFFGNTMVLGGTEGDDRLQAGHADDDTVWGDGGNDWIDGGNGNDFLYGGDGDDTIVDTGGLDVIHGDAGNDTIYAGDGDDIALGGDGNDWIDGGLGIDVVQGGLGNDILKGGGGDDEVVGNSGDDWLEGGDGGDLIIGDQAAPTGLLPLVAFNDVLIGGAGGDRMQGFSGDDIMVGEGGFDTFDGGLGFDWATFEFETAGVTADMNRAAFIADPLAPGGAATRSVFVGTEGISGSRFNDVLTGTNTFIVAPQFNELSNVNLIVNLDTFFPSGPVAFSNGDIMLGGDGSDTIKGGAGNDIIDGDAWLHVELAGSGAAGSDIIRQIRWDVTGGDIDTAVYNGNFADYAIGLAPDAQGFITVQHIVPALGLPVGVVNEGTDKLRNIERLQFADRTIVLDNGPGANQVPTGTLTISGDQLPATPVVDPRIGVPLTANWGTIADPDGIVAGTIKFQWQAFSAIKPQWVDITGANADTFTPTNAQLAQNLRVVMTFTDGAGVTERVVSAATALPLPDLATNTAPFVRPQLGVVGLPDTNALTNKPFDIFLPLITTFGDNETAPSLLTYTASLANGAALATVGLSFTLVPDGLGGVSGAHLTGNVLTPTVLNVRITATDNGPGTPLSATDTFLINVQQAVGTPSTNAAPENLVGGIEDTQFRGTLLPGTDPTNDPLAFKLVNGSAVNGTVSINASTGVFLFNPAADYAGTASFQYYVTDGLYNSAPKTVTVNFTPVDDGVAPLFLTGSASRGGTLSALFGLDPDGAIDPATATYKWFVDGVQVQSGASADYVVKASDVGKNISVSAVYTDGQGNVNTTNPAVSDAAFIGTVGVAGVAGNDLPKITGSTTVIDPDGGPTPDGISYKWETSANGINGWTAETLTVTGVNTEFFNPTAATGAAGRYVRATATFVDGNGNIETVLGDAVHYIVDANTSNASLVGTAASELIFGMGGNDSITGGAGDDFVSGGTGNDTFNATIGDGNDTYDGGSGTDTYTMVATSAAANADLTAGTATSAQTGNDILVSIENVTGSAGDNIIIGSAATNVLIGNGGNDTLDGGSAGLDDLRGGTGNDTYIVSHGGMTLTENPGAGTDTVMSSIAFTLGLNFENLTLTGTANVSGTGNTGNNVIQGNSGNNVLSGLGGNDTFLATIGDGNDIYNGGGGTDTLDLSFITTGVNVNLVTGIASSAQTGTDNLTSIERVVGGSGNDIFTAGLGQETFAGNAGADTFVFRTSAAAGAGAGNRTVITDFVHGQDKIDLQFLDANAGTGGLQHFTYAGVLGAAVNPGAGQIGVHYVTIAGVAHTIIEGNVAGTGAQIDFQIDLLGTVALDATDFVLGGP